MSSERDRTVTTRKQVLQLLLKVVDSGTITQLRKTLQSPDLDVNGCNKHGECALHIAAGYGRIEFVKELFEAGASLDCSDKHGDTPLYWASRHGHDEVVQYLCESGKVDINYQDHLGETSALVATRYAQPEVLSILNQFCADFDLQDKEGECPLLCACWHGYQMIVEQLIQYKASLTVRNINGDTCFHVAAVRGFSTILRILCQNGAELNPINMDGYTPLMLATKRNHLDIVQYLCEQTGCDVNIQNLDGDTALHEACREGRLSLVYTLTAAGANLDVTNKRGQRPIHVAAMKGQIEISRYLCSSRCNLNVVDMNGNTADALADRSGHTALADMLTVLRQGNMRDKCLNELSLNSTQANRVRLLVCGASGVGKTTLISSLRSKFLRSIRRPTFGGSYLGSSALEHTYGFCVQRVSIPGAGEFVVWDFSGCKEYYPIHEFFLDCRNGIYLVVYDSTSSFDVQLAQVRFWLAMIKSKHKPNLFIEYAGQYKYRPHVVLVESFIDISTENGGMVKSMSRGSTGLDEEEEQFMATSPLSDHLKQLKKKQSGVTKLNTGPLERNNGVLECVVSEFGDHFNFTNTVFHLDARQPRGREMRRLKTLLGTLRETVLNQQPWVPELFITLQEVLPEWRKELTNFPVVTWSKFFSQVKERINPLVSEDRLHIVMDALTDVGELIHIKEGHLKDIVILEADWLGQRVFGPALAPENSPIMKLRSMTGRVPLGEVQRVYPELDPSSLLHLLEYFELCRPVGHEIAFEFPSLIKIEPLYGVWERDPELTVYSGVQVRCTSVSSVFSPSLFPRAQLQIRRAFIDDIEDQELILWRDGLKCSRGEVEICMRQMIPNWCIEIVVRGLSDSRTECYALLQQFYSILLSTIHISNPGTIFTTEVLSCRSLIDHAHKPHLYSSMEIFEAERSSTNDMLTPPTDNELPEALCDLLCCGWKGGEITAKSAPYTSVRDIPLQTRVQICRMLDPPDPLGRDWCLLALQLGLQDEVPAIDNSLNRGSPTDRLLTAWDKGGNQTIVSLVDVLRSIGRDDVGLEVLNGLSPFNNPNNSLVWNITGVVSTSYIV